MSEEAEKLTPEQPADAGFSSPEEQVEEAEAQASKQEDPTQTIESLAAAMGWHEMENGKSAFEFIRDTADINNSLRKRVERLSDQVDTLVSNSTKQTIKALQEQKERLQKEFEEAVESGDKQAASKASKRLSELEAEKPKEEDPRIELARKWQPYAANFEAQNANVLQNKRAFAKAKIYLDAYAESGMEPEDAYKAVEDDLKKEFPEFYTNQNRERPAKVGGDTAPKTGSSAWSKLLKEMPEAERHFKEFVDMGVYKDTKEHREKYAKMAQED